MTDNNPITIIAEAIDKIGDSLKGHPIEIPRPGKETFVLVSAQTYSDLIARIHELEQATMSDEDRAAEQDEMLSLLRGDS